MERARRSILVLANPAPSQTTAMFRRKNSSGDGSCRRRVERHVPEDYNQFRVFLEPPEGEQNHEDCHEDHPCQQEQATQPVTSRAARPFGPQHFLLWVIGGKTGRMDHGAP